MVGVLVAKRIHAIGTRAERDVPCIILLLVRVELVVEVVLGTLLGELQVGGEVVDAFVHSLLLLMQRSLYTKEVALGDV